MTDLTHDDMHGYAQPHVPLRLTFQGPGARPDIIDYVRTVIEQRTTVNPDSNPERLARCLVTSILSRLGADYPIASGQATVQLGPGPRYTVTLADAPAASLYVDEEPG